MSELKTMDPGPCRWASIRDFGTYRWASEYLVLQDVYMSEERVSGTPGPCKLLITINVLSRVLSTLCCSA